MGSFSAPRLSESLVRHGALPADTVRVALGRQIVYGGALDTALLEMGVIDEAAIWGELSRASGLPIPEPALVESADPTVGALFDLGRSKRCRAVPVARRGDTLQLLCGDPVEDQTLREASADLGLELELFVVPEVRLRVARQAVYGQPMPARFLRLLARLLGTEPVRRWAETHAAHRARRSTPDGVEQAPPPPADPPPESTGPAPGVELHLVHTADIVATISADIAAMVTEPASPSPAPQPSPEASPPVPAAADEEALFRAAANPASPGHVEALRTVRRHPDTPLARELAATFREDASFGSSDKALPAIEALGELRDGRSVVLLVGLVKSEDATLAHAAQRALVEITKQDFGASRRRWTTWWQEHGHEQRTDWLFEGLTHKVAEIRASAAEELRELSGGEYFGYHFDLPKAEREAARRRWQAWWNERAGVRTRTPPPPSS